MFCLSGRESFCFSWYMISSKFHMPGWFWSNYTPQNKHGTPKFDGLAWCFLLFLLGVFSGSMLVFGGVNASPFPSGCIFRLQPTTLPLAKCQVDSENHRNPNFGWFKFREQKIVDMVKIWPFSGYKNLHASMLTFRPKKQQQSIELPWAHDVVFFKRCKERADFQWFLQNVHKTNL